jgi:UDP-N-acetylmuramyl pentapeptide phosphotransferase/UDP-N-acetylglucosamine-1-phosphate transferase
LHTLRVFTIRAAKGKSPLSADKNHLHHKMLEKDKRHKKTVITIYIFTLIMIALAFFVQFKEPSIIFGVCLVACAIFVAYVFYLSKGKK